jgi:hypothetical protein
MSKKIIKLLKKIEKNTRPSESAIYNSVTFLPPEITKPVQGPPGPTGAMGPKGDTGPAGKDAGDPFQGRTGRDQYIEESDEEYDARIEAQYGYGFGL